MAITIPQPFSQPFVNGIRHPDLYLWDAWSFVDLETQFTFIHSLSAAPSQTARPCCQPIATDFRSISVISPRMTTV